MDLKEILEAVDKLSPEERKQLEGYLAERQVTPRVDTTRPRRSAAEWMAELEDIAREFRGDSTDEEMKEIFEAMSYKSKPSDKGL